MSWGRSAEERFWEKVNKTAGCWLWTAGTTGCPTHPYGLFRASRVGGMMKAHQYSYIRAYGFIPRGKVLLHNCDETLCVKPAHLRAGSQRENVLDAVAKGRWTQGGRPGPRLMITRGLAA
jgi:hypothetical protein